MSCNKENVQESDDNTRLVFEGITYPAFTSFAENGVDAHLKDIHNLTSKETDIILCSYPKSGTHWILDTIKLIIHPGEKLPDSLLKDTFLDYIDLSSLHNINNPRLLCSHILPKYLPKDHIKLGGRIIHLMRNPKDVCVSAFNHFKKDPRIKDGKSWEDCFDKFLTGVLPYGFWFDHTKEYEELKRKYPKQVYAVIYEDMKMNPRNEIKKLADFLGLPCTDQQAEVIAMITDFENMKINKFDSMRTVTKDGEGVIFRKGVIGDWKNWFTVSQNEIFNCHYKEKMADSKYKTDFDKYL